MKKFLSLLLSLCLLLGTLPLQVSAFAGDIFPSEGAVKSVTLEDGSLSLQNEYIHMTFRKLWGTYAYLTVAPAAKPDEESIDIKNPPICRAASSSCLVDSRPLLCGHGQNAVTDTFQFTGAVIALHILAVSGHGVG